MNRMFSALTTAVTLTTPAAGDAFASTTPFGTGRPSQMSNSATPPTTSGSTSNPSGVAGSRYAGTQPQNGKDPKSVSQYGVACYQVSH